ncbi:MAG: YraN family protein [Planctomycetota bacterium]|jgi:putative endonuclease
MQPGRAGERAAEKELRRRGMKVLERNLRSGGSELDLVALDGETFVFVEVKSRSSAAHGDPAEAVDLAKRRRVVRAARAFLAGKRLMDRPRRYDVAAVMLDEKGRASSVRWTEGAFDEGEAR